MKKMLSVGAGVEQVPVIEKAMKRGLYVIAIDGNKNAKGLSIANEGHCIDISDADRVVEFAKDKRIEGVLQAPIGRYLSVIGKINSNLNLIGISEQGAINSTDKKLQNEILNINNISCARQKELNEETFNEFNIPFIIKPRFGSGSKGVKVIMDRNEVLPQGEYLVEEMLDGIEYGVDFLVSNGTGVLVCVREKELTKLPYRQEVSIVAATDLSDNMYAKINSIMTESVNALNINNTLVHADIMINDKNEISIIEISGRPSGLLLSTKVLPLITELDYIGLGIDIVVGNTIDIKDIKQNNVGITFFDLKEGILENIPTGDSLNILEMKCNLKVGDEITKVKNGKDIFDRGYSIVRGNSSHEIKSIFKQIIGG